MCLSVSPVFFPLFRFFSTHHCTGTLHGVYTLYGIVFWHKEIDYIYWKWNSDRNACDLMWTLNQKWKCKKYWNLSSIRFAFCFFSVVALNAVRHSLHPHCERLSLKYTKDTLNGIRMIQKSNTYMENDEKKQRVRVKKRGRERKRVIVVGKEPKEKYTDIRK